MSDRKQRLQLTIFESFDSIVDSDIEQCGNAEATGLVIVATLSLLAALRRTCMANGESEADTTARLKNLCETIAQSDLSALDVLVVS